MVVGAPELLVLQHYLLQVFKADDHGVDLAKLAKFEELNGRDLVAIA